MGLLLSVMIGPVFFTLIQSSLSHGFRYAAVLAIGILSSDIIYVLITYFGINLISEIAYFEYILGLVGGAILMGFGINSILKKQVGRPNSGGISLPKPLKRNGFLKGFSINGINPFVLLFWISIASLVQVKTDFKNTDVIGYYSGLLITVFCIDLLKSFIAKQLSGFVTPRVMLILNKLVGVIMIGFGLRMIWWACVS